MTNKIHQFTLDKKIQTLMIPLLAKISKQSKHLVLTTNNSGGRQVPARAFKHSPTSPYLNHIATTQFWLHNYRATKAQTND